MFPKFRIHEDKIVYNSLLEQDELAMLKDKIGEFCFSLHFQKAQISTSFMRISYTDKCAICFSKHSQSDFAYKTK